MAIRVGLWDCDICNTNGISGELRRCPNCGAARPSTVKFYLLDDAEIVTDVNKIKEAKAGPDWICTFCGTGNSALKTECINCGASFSDSELKLQQKITMYGQEVQKKDPVPKAVPKKKSSKVLAFSTFVFLALILFLIFGLRKTETYTVVSKVWNTTYEIEKYAWIVESDWKLPDNAILISSKDSIHHYNKIQVGTETKTREVREKVGEREYVCGQKDLGNGYFEDVYCTEDIYEYHTEEYEDPKYEKEPVYQTLYKYKIHKWKKAEPLSLKGVNCEIKWPIVKSDTIRKIDSVATLELFFKTKKGDEVSKKVNIEVWTKYNLNDNVKVKRSIFSRKLFKIK